MVVSDPLLTGHGIILIPKSEGISIIQNNFFQQRCLGLLRPTHIFIPNLVELEIKGRRTFLKFWLNQNRLTVQMLIYFALNDYWSTIKVFMVKRQIRVGDSNYVIVSHSVLKVTKVISVLSLL